MSSFLLSSTLNTSLAWSLGNGGKGRFAITFPSDLSWYYEQPCREFQSWQHRKVRSGLRHEYIVLFFLDGSICRLERMGDPFARVEALTSRGTTAHDIAQCFRPDQICKARIDDSDIVVEVTLPEARDLIDVLRVCRAIQEGDKTCNYTLLSSNCYFFCLAIQACLTRLVADWEIENPADSWVSVMHGSDDLLANTLLSTKHRKSPLLEIYSMFSDSSSLVRRVAKEIAEKADGSLVQELVNQALDTELWYSDLESRVIFTVQNIAKEALVHVLEQDTQTLICRASASSQSCSESSETDLYNCEKMLACLVSLAAERHRQQTAKIRKEFSCISASGPRLNILDFCPPSTTLRLVGDSPSTLEQVFLWLPPSWHFNCGNILWLIC
ncbi:hypothetical protein BDV93DRAFT_567144 [Ceratobasidium sp. AG-I]|nr:hypothetical protein BDV93DRAFT_567144 [Ceratobasidium sp. AG-I]